ncbi:MAG: hypothetical protein R3B47_02090 [Bacteroidia bacterium]
MREVFEMRLFHSFITEVSGVGVTSLPEAEQRRQQLVEFEHYLWVIDFSLYIFEENPTWPGLCRVFVCMLG